MEAKEQWESRVPNYLQIGSDFGADAVCGCAYDEENNLLVAAKIDKGDSRNCRIMAYRKE